jgi:hypothetical protein
MSTFAVVLETYQNLSFMGKGTVERFGLKAIADAVRGSGVAEARDRLLSVVGAVVEVSGTVQKRVRREGECKLVIEPGASVPGFVVFADCLSDAENLTKLHIRKGSSVRVKGSC